MMKLFLFLFSLVAHVCRDLALGHPVKEDALDNRQYMEALKLAQLLDRTRQAFQKREHELVRPDDLLLENVAEIDASEWLANADSLRDEVRHICFYFKPKHKAVDSLLAVIDFRSAVPGRRVRP